MKPIHPYANIERDMLAYEGGGVQLELFPAPKTYSAKDVILEINGVKLEGFVEFEEIDHGNGYTECVINGDRDSFSRPWYALGRFTPGEETLRLNRIPINVGSFIVIDQEFTYIYAGNGTAFLCNGNERSILFNKELFEAIGHKYGISSNVYNFVLPNYMEQFDESEYKKTVFLKG